MRRVVMSLLGLSLLGATCHPAPILADLAKCEETAAVKQFPALVPIVGAVLASGGTNAAVDAALLGLVVAFGVDSVDCAVHAVLAGIGQVSASQPTKMLRGADLDTAKVRAQGWLKSRGGKRTVTP